MYKTYNPPSQISYQYRQLAKKIVESCPKNFASEIALTGSAARGTADEDSDIELNCWVKNDIPSRAERQWWLESIGAKEISFDEEPISDGSFWATFLLEGTWVEIGWQTETKQEQLLDAILKGCVLDTGRLINAGLIAHSVVLRSNGQLLKWQGKLEVYPKVLAQNLIADLLESWQYPHLLKVRWALVRRKQPFALTQRLTQDINNLIRILFALNNQWETDTKWLDLIVSQMSIKPIRLVERVNNIFSCLSLGERVFITVELIVETLKLIPSSEQIKKTIVGLENSLKEAKDHKELY